MAVFILSIGMMGTLSYFVTTKVAVEMARDQTTAAVHAEYILEEMCTQATLAEITATDWPAFVAAAGLDTLNSEVVTVAFADVDADPLSITVTVAWKNSMRDSSTSIVTEMTR